MILKLSYEREDAESGFIKILPEIFSFVKSLPVQSTEYFILLSSTFPPRVHCQSVRTAGSNVVLVELSGEQQQHTLFFLLYTCMYVYRGFPGGSVVKNLPANVRDVISIPGSGRSPSWRKKWQPIPVFLPGKSHGQRGLEGYSPWGCKRIGHD